MKSSSQKAFETLKQDVEYLRDQASLEMRLKVLAGECGEETAFYGLQVKIDSVHKMLVNARTVTELDIPLQTFREASILLSQAQQAQAAVRRTDGAKMVFIPASNVLIGSNDNDHEKPERTIFLEGYWIDKHPVTVRQWKQFVNETGYSGKKLPPAPDFNKEWAKDDHPIVHISKLDADAYCDWQTKETGAPIHIPSEKQWEKAARGSSGGMFPWGGESADDYDDTKAWTSVKSRRTGTAYIFRETNVCTSPFGCIDMAGNVWQWTSNTCDGAHDRCFLRGGAWVVTVPRYVRGANRNGVSPSGRSDNVGFRCASSYKSLFGI